MQSFELEVHLLGGQVVEVCLLQGTRDGSLRTSHGEDGDDGGDKGTRLD